MITVSFIREKGLYTGFDCSGHAGYADAGSDIICSAVSALTQTTVLGITEVAQIPARVTIKNEGHIHCCIGKDTSDTQRKEADLLLSTLSMGLHAVDESYPGYLKIFSKEV